MTLVKKLKVFHLLCLSKIDREKEFADILHKIEAVKDLKTTFYEKRKTIVFPNRLVHRFGQK